MNEIYTGFNNTASEIELRKKIADLEGKLSQQVKHYKDLSTIGIDITSTLELNKILSVVVESAMAAVNAKAGQIVLFGENGGIKDTICRGMKREYTELIRYKDETGIWEYLYNKRWLRIPEFGKNADWKFKSNKWNLYSLVAGPLISTTGVVGAIVLYNKKAGGCFTDDDMAMLDIISRFASVAVKNCYLHSDELIRQKLEYDKIMFRQLQSMLMPDRIFENDKLRITAFNTMAIRAGGDFYDIVRLSDSRFILVVADVSNKGFPASILMSSTRSLIRAYSAESESLSEIALKLNEQLCDDSPALKGMFVTLIMVYLDFDSGEIRSINAGHPPGWINLPGGKIAELKSGGPCIGQLEGLKYSEQVLPLKTGSRIFLFTDGIYECVNSGGRMLGISGIKSFFAKNRNESPEIFEHKMKRLLKAYSVDPDRIDDTTYILADVK